MRACNKVFDFSSFLHLVLLLSWKGGERDDNLRAKGNMEGNMKGRSCLERRIPEEGRSVLPNISQFLIFFLNSSL